MRNMKSVFLGGVLIVCCLSVKAQQNITKYIKCYFSQPVDNSLSNGVNATYLKNSMFDTLAAYINRAKYTIDIAQYEYETYTGDPIYTALNNAQARGVKIRYIEDYSYSTKNTGVQKLKNIPFLISPTLGASSCTTSNGSESYNIMHNKFVVFDVYSPDSTQSLVWTGSADWSGAMNTGDYNNTVIVESKVLARAFTNEFNIMWGDTTHGGAADSAAAKFGSCKPNSGRHLFTIGGSRVELYFSPSDSVNNHILKTIELAKTDLYSGMFTFTEANDADSIVAHYKKGAYAAAILDSFSSDNATPNTIYKTTFPTGLGKYFHGYVNNNYLYHNKYIVVNPSAPCEHPAVLTGSHNWTSSANEENDENTLIIYNDTIANEYLQAFAEDFKVIAGWSLTPPANPCPPLGVNNIAGTQSTVDVYPNPYKNEVTIAYNQAEDGVVSIAVYNVMGQKVADMVNNQKLNAGHHQYTFNGLSDGVYILKISENGNVLTRKLIRGE